MVKIDIVMPTYCYDCPCHNGENGRCNITGDSVFDKRPFDCPLREDKSTTDDEEVKHGEWIPHPVGEYLSMDNDVCSNCGEQFYQITQTGCVWNYCPNCGAKMSELQKLIDEGKENEDV